MPKLIQTEKNISYFKTDLAKLRAKPSMYIGPIDESGIFTILREVLDNAVDEARADRNDLISVWHTKEGFWVLDAGEGIPVGIHKEAKVSTLTHVLTAFQSSGKMQAGAFKSAIGTHGIGIKATNALSEKFIVYTFRKKDGGWFSTEYSRGEMQKKPAKCNAPVLPDKTKPKHGTVVFFKPDDQVFKGHVKDWLANGKLADQFIKPWCEMAAYMNSGLEILFTDLKAKTTKWKFKDGIKQYLDKRLVELKATALSKKPVAYSSSTLELALHFADVEGSEMQFHTNTIRNIDQGFHADAFYKALVESLKPFKGKLEYTPTDLKDGLVGILNYKIDAPQFSSQTKEKLVDVRVFKPCFDECLKLLTAYFNANKTLAKQIVSRAAELRKKTADFLKDKKLIKNVRDAKKKVSAKLCAITGKTPIEQRELYLIEGDSAGGTAKLARFKDFQATYPLKGKPLNVVETAKEKVNNNQEIADVFAAIGVDPGVANPLEKIQYGKIIFLADPDVDGYHINVLLMGLFWRYLPTLIKSGRVYMVRSPEYKAKYKGKTIFGDTKQAIVDQVKGSKVNIEHIKGYGEMQPEDLRPVAFDVDKRNLIQIVPPKTKSDAANFQSLLGKSTKYRQTLMLESAKR